VDHSARVSMKSKANFAKFCELQDALIIDFSNAHAAIAFTSYCYVCQRVGSKTIITDFYVVACRDCRRPRFEVLMALC